MRVSQVGMDNDELHPVSVIRNSVFAFQGLEIPSWRLSVGCSEKNVEILVQIFDPENGRSNSENGHLGGQ